MQALYSSRPGTSLCPDLSRPDPPIPSLEEPGEHPHLPLEARVLLFMEKDGGSHSQFSLFTSMPSRGQVTQIFLRPGVPKLR